MTTLEELKRALSGCRATLRADQRILLESLSGSTSSVVERNKRALERFSSLVSVVQAVCDIIDDIPEKIRIEGRQKLAQAEIDNVELRDKIEKMRKETTRYHQLNEIRKKQFVVLRDKLHILKERKEALENKVQILQLMRAKSSLQDDPSGV